MSKKIDLSTKEGLDKLRAKAKDYGHYAEFLQVIELIDEVEKHRNERKELIEGLKEAFKWVSSS